jgi:hypothetical protein
VCILSNVYVIHQGSAFDVPIDKVWKYLSSDQHRHPSVKVLNREAVGNTVTLTSERNIMGKKALVKVRNTLYPPFGMVQEHLEEPHKGSRAFQYYIPKGNKTGVCVVGDYMIQGVSNDDEQSIREAVLEQAKTIFDEDNSNLKNMA